MTGLNEYTVWYAPGSKNGPPSPMGGTLEDFGAAKLEVGRAVVKLDIDFAKVVTLNEYHVFVTPSDDCRGLCVRNKTATSFEVCELAGGKSSVAFSYRIVARRKDIKEHQRFAKIDTRLTLPATAARPPPKRAPTRTERRAPAPRIEVQDALAVRREARKRRSADGRARGQAEDDARSGACAAVIRHSQERVPYGLFVPDVP